MLYKFNVHKSQPYNLKYTSNHPVVNGLVDKLWAELPLDKTKMVDLKKECLVNTLINLNKGYYNCKYVRYSRRKNNYAELPIRYKPEYYTYNIMTGIMDGLESLGLIKSLPGFMNLNDNTKLQTAICVSDGFFKELQPIKNYMVKNVYPKEPIILKSRQDKMKIDYKDTIFTKKMRRDLDLYNELRQKTKFTMSALTQELLNLNSDYFNQFSLTELRPETTTVELSNPFVYRVFSGSFRSGGRFYNGLESNASKDLRSRILINGNPTVEKDFSCMHINMLYNKENQSLKEDAYNKLSGGDPKLRQLFKLIGLVSINSENLKKCFSALRYEIYDNGLKSYFEDLTDNSISRYYDQWVQAHPVIAKYLSSDVGIKLQYQDSRIAAGIINYFTEKGVPVLVVHDSFIIEKKYESELVDKMKSVYKGIFKFEPNVK